MAKLIFEIQESDPIEVELDKRISFGSSEGNDVQVDGEGVDAFHSVIFRDESGAYWVKSLSNSLSTVVNGHQIELGKLRDLDQISMGVLHGVFHEADSGAALEVSEISVGIEKEKIEEEIKSLEAQKEELQKEVEALRGEKAKLQEGLGKEQKALSEVKESLAKDQKEKKELEPILGKLRDEKSALKDQLEKLKIEFEEQGRRKTEISNLMLSLEKDRDQSSKQLKELTQKETDLQSSFKNLEAEVSKLQLKQKDVLNDLKELEKKRESESGIHREIEALKQELKLNEADLQKAHATLHNHHDEVSNLRQQCETYRKEKDSLLSQFELLEKRLNEATDWLIRHDQVANSVQEEVETLHSTKAQLEEECKEEVARLERWKREVIGLQSKHARLMKQVEQAQGRTLHLSEIQEFLGKGEELWRQKEDEMERQFLEDQQVLEDLKKEIEVVRKQLK